MPKTPLLNGPEFGDGVNREEARVVIEIWRRHYNEERPHQSLKDLTPLEFKARYDSINQGAALNT